MREAIVCLNSSYYSPAHREGAVSVAFVHPSIRHPSHTQRIIWKPKSLACPNLEGRFPTLDATHVPVSRSTGQRSVTRPISADTHHAPYLANSKLPKPTIVKLGLASLGWRTTTRIHHGRHDLQGQRSKSSDQSESRLGLMLYLCH